MIKIEAGSNGNFIINGDPRQRGSFNYIFTGNGDSYLRVFPIHDLKSQAYKGEFPSEWVKAGDVPFTDKADFISYINDIMFL